MLPMSQVGQKYIGDYLSRLAAGGVSLIAKGNRVIVLPELNPVMESGESVPLGTMQTIAKREAEIVSYYNLGSEEGLPYPHLTPEEVQLSDLVLDMLDEQELDRLAAHKAMYGITSNASSDGQTASKSAPVRADGAYAPGASRSYRPAKTVDRSSWPEYHETPEERRSRRLLESMNRLDAAGTRVSQSLWTFEKGETIKWVKRTKPDGSTSTHLFTFNAEYGGAVCDCKQKEIRPSEPCVHEIARTEELKRREFEAEL
jgi:hypothetical protein